MDELKPCPFCGAKYSSEKFEKNTVQIMLGERYYWVVCLKCEVRTGEYSKKEKAVKAWNRRVKDDKTNLDCPM